MTSAINSNAFGDSATPGLALTREQVNTYIKLLREPEARRAATVTLAAIQGFASRLNVADLLRGSVVHGGNWEAWLAELAQEASRNLETVRAYRASFEGARRELETEVHGFDAAVMDLLTQRRQAAAMAESKASSTKQDMQTMSKSLSAAGLTSAEVSAHINQRFSGGFEELEAELLGLRDAHLADAAALEAFLADSDRSFSALPGGLREEIQELAKALPIRATACNHMSVAATRAW